MPLSLIRAAALLVLAACPTTTPPHSPSDDGGTSTASGGAGTSPGTTSMPAAQPPVHLFTQQNSAYRLGDERVLRDQGAWDAVWQTLHGGTPAERAPTVDFARDMVVLVALGEASTGGYDVHIDDVTPESGGAVVRYTVTEPGPGCMTTQAITAPADVVRVPRAVGAARFVRQTVKRGC